MSQEAALERYFAEAAAWDADRAALDQFLARGDHLLRALSDSLSTDYFQPPVAPHALLTLPVDPP